MQACWHLQANNSRQTSCCATVRPSKSDTLLLQPHDSFARAPSKIVARVMAVPVVVCVGATASPVRRLWSACSTLMADRYNLSSPRDSDLRGRLVRPNVSPA